jgi:hypothetical protein
MVNAQAESLAQLRPVRAALKLLVGLRDAARLLLLDGAAADELMVEQPRRHGLQMLQPVGVDRNGVELVIDTRLLDQLFELALEA